MRAPLSAAEQASLAKWRRGLLALWLVAVGGMLAVNVLQPAPSGPAMHANAR